MEKKRSENFPQNCVLLYSVSPKSETKFRVKFFSVPFTLKGMDSTKILLRKIKCRSIFQEKERTTSPYNRESKSLGDGLGMTVVLTSSSASSEAAATAARTAPTSPVSVTKPLPPMA